MEYPIHGTLPIHKRILRHIPKDNWCHLGITPGIVITKCTAASEALPTGTTKRGRPVCIGENQQHSQTKSNALGPEKQPQRDRCKNKAETLSLTHTLSWHLNSYKQRHILKNWLRVFLQMVEDGNVVGLPKDPCRVFVKTNRAR